MRRKDRGQLVPLPGDDVDDARRHVGAVEDLGAVDRGERPSRRGNHHHRIAHRHRRQQDREEAQERRRLGRNDSHHSNGLGHGQGDVAEGCGVNPPVVLVGPGGIGKRALDPRLYLGGGGLGWAVR